ncbi:MmpS family transport accessory protein [Streptomyces sp. NPDC017993]|uniref:MmpS family transport accessory protein n=1 Tax=Streptomyces sp. NPDC017993 TaxID=3365027 RepID=UPI00378F8A83
MVLGLCLLLVGGCAAAVAVLVSDVTEEITKTVQVSYEVTGDAKDVAITYSTWRDEDMSTSQATARTLPWTKEMQAEGLVKGGALSITLGAGGGTATCSVSVDGAQAKTATATGPNATASCGY